MTTLTQAQRTAALSHLEKVVTESGSTLRSSDGSLFAKLMRLVDSIRLGRATGAEVTEVSVALGRWHLTQQRAAFAAQLATVGPFAAQGLPWALDTVAALEAMIHLLDRTLAQTRPEQRRPGPAAVEGVAKLSEAVKARFESARRSIAAAKKTSPPLAARATPARALRHIAAR